MRSKEEHLFSRVPLMLLIVFILGALLVPTTLSYADEGAGAGEAGGNYGGPGSGMSFRWWAHDNKTRSGSAFTQMTKWGGWSSSPITSARLRNFFINGPGAQEGTSASNKAPNGGVCYQATTKAIAKHGGKRSDYRIVLVGTFLGDDLGTGKGKMPYDGAPGNNHALRNSLQSGWGKLNVGLQAKTGDKSGYHDYVYQLAYAESGPRERRVCVVLKYNQPANPSYQLKVKTEAQGTFSVAGTTAPVRDKITLTPSSSASPEESLQVQTTLNWAGNATTGAKEVSKTKSATNRGSHVSPEFKPNDFGFSTWPSGEYWFDVTIKKQKNLSKKVELPGRDDPQESWSVSVPAPKKVLVSDQTGKQLDPKTRLAAGMGYIAQVEMNAAGYREFVIRDLVETDQVSVGSPDSDSPKAVQVFTQEGKALPAKNVVVDIDRSQKGQVVVTAKVTLPKSFDTTADYTLNVPTYVLATGKGGDLPDKAAACYEQECVDGNRKKVEKVVPKQDKVWVVDKEGALVAADPDWTNNVGSDGQVLLHEEPVGAVVNGHIPRDLAQNLSSYSMEDDWSQAEKYVDFTNIDEEHVWVYADGKDVTHLFAITKKGHRTIATAQKGFLERTGSQPRETQMKLVVLGHMRPFSAETDTSGQRIEVRNSGSQKWNGEVGMTNEPAIFVWNPHPNKKVKGEISQGGKDQSIDKTMVFPGQKIKYELSVDMGLPKQLQHDLNFFGIEDTYDPLFDPEKTTLQVVGSEGVISRDRYQVEWDDSNHKFVVSFAPDWVLNNVGERNLTITVSGFVSPEAQPGVALTNSAEQVVNESRTPTPKPSVEIPRFEPVKEDLKCDYEEGSYTNCTDIDGKVVVSGDRITYRLTLDAQPARSRLAYDVHKLGLVDHFDAKFVDLKAEDIRVFQQESGENVTEKFNVQVLDSKAYIFAKQVDTVLPGGQTIAGDPQPLDLAKYARSAIDASQDATIDQSLLGKKYYVYLTATVKNAADGKVIKNVAEQNLENLVKRTQVVSNELKNISPSKDVSVEVGGASVNGTEIPLREVFNYRLSSSVLPANRAYPTSEWSLVDNYDQVADRYTGSWQVLATTDLYEGDQLVAGAGDILAQDQGSRQGDREGENFFKVTDSDGVLRVEANGNYLRLINEQLGTEQGWEIYVQMERIRPGTIINTMGEQHNGQERPANEVATETPENPQISLEKFDTQSGEVSGDRDSAEEALKMDSSEQELSFLIKNEGDVPLHKLELSDRTLRGSGHVEALTCAEELDKIVLQPKETVSCSGSLLGVNPGSEHRNEATATATSLYTGSKVEDLDLWNAFRPEGRQVPLAKTGASVSAGLMGLGLVVAGGSILMRRREY